MAEAKQPAVNFKIPTVLWPIAVVTSAVLAILEATGVAQVPWWTRLLPVGAVIALGLAIVVVGPVLLLLAAAIVTVWDKAHRSKMRRRARKASGSVRLR